MTLFITKVWGFHEPVGPLPFGTTGWRAHARRQLKPGDLVVLVGTTDDPTEEDERGRLLGIMEPTTEVVSSLDFNLRRRPCDYDERGNYLWPFGLLNRRAWRLVDRPLLTDVSSRRFSMDAARSIVPLNDEEAARVLKLRRVESQLLASTRDRARVEGEERARRRAAPPPTTQRRGVMHMRRAPAYTYAMEIVGASQPSFKVGWAFDYEARQRNFNQAALPQLGGLRYQTMLYHLWDTAREAYTMEQALLAHLAEYRHVGNHEVVCGISRDGFQAVWVRFVVGRGRVGGVVT